MNHHLVKFNQEKSIKYRNGAKEVIRKTMLENPELGMENLAKLTGYGTGVTSIYYIHFKRHGLNATNKN